VEPLKIREFSIAGTTGRKAEGYERNPCQIILEILLLSIEIPELK
jgi:hypothetical protein